MSECLTPKALFRKIHRKFGGKRVVRLHLLDLAGVKPPLFGVCVPCDDGSFNILVDKHLDNRVQNHFIIHEYAHTMTPEFGAAHGPCWGVIHAAIYSFIFDSIPVTGKRRKRKISVGSPQ